MNRRSFLSLPVLVPVTPVVSIKPTTKGTQSGGTLVRRVGSRLCFSKDHGVTWSRWYDTTLERLFLKIEHGVDVDD